MDCRQFQSRLSGYLSGRTGAAEAAEMERHFGSCPECSRLLEVPVSQDAGPEPAFVESVLARTSGSACATARLYLSRAQDGDLDSFRATLLERHLERCPHCVRVGEVLEQLALVLPTLAVEDPGPDFTASVLAACRRPARRRDRTWLRRLQSWSWRPLFPLEAAYLGTLLFVLGFTAALGSPSASTLTRIESAVAPAAGWVEQVETYWIRWTGAAAERMERLHEWSQKVVRRCGQEAARIAEDVQERVRRAAD